MDHGNHCQGNPRRCDHHRQMKADRIGAGILSLGGKDFGAAQLFLRDREDNIIAHFDGEARSWNELRAGAMYAPNVPRRTTLEDELSTTSLYVHPVAGDDVEGDGTSSHPFRTLQRAVDFIPEVNDATWDIRVIEPTKYPISEHLEIRGFRGDGIVRFRMDGVRFNGWVRLSSNLHRFAFYGGHYYHNGQGHPRTPEGPIATFHVIRTNILYMENCYVSAEQKAEHAMSATYGSFVEAHDCYLDRGLRNGAQAIRGSKMYINNCGGRENGEFGAYASINSEIAISGDVVDQKIYCPAGKGGGTGEDHFFWYSTWTSEVRVPSTYAGRKRSGSRVAIPENKILTAYPTEVASWRGQGGDTDDGPGLACRQASPRCGLLSPSVGRGGRRIWREPCRIRLVWQYQLQNPAGRPDHQRCTRPTPAGPPIHPGYPEGSPMLVAQLCPPR